MTSFTQYYGMMQYGERNYSNFETVARCFGPDFSPVQIINMF